jgi:hypothetical protein
MKASFIEAAVVLLLTILSVAEAVFYDVPVQQIEVLKEAYKLWNGANAKGDFTNWNFTKNAVGNYAVSPCADPNVNVGDHWDYVTCEYLTTTAKITKLIYNGQTVISGKIPANIGALTALTDLVISEQALSGTIPSLSALTKLQTLNLGGNKLTGPMPAFKPIRTSILSIDVSSNFIIDELNEPDLGALNSLMVLKINDNKFNGTVPNTLFHSLKDLVTLDLSLNEFTGKVQYDSFNYNTAMESLNLGKNSFTGSLPSIQTMPRLANFMVDTNSFSGSLQSSFFNLGTLVDLRLGHNKLTGTISSEININTDLMILHLGSNKFGGTLPSLSGLQNALLYVDIADNGFTGDFPDGEFFGENCTLRVVELGNNNFNPGPIPPSIFHSSMEKFDISFGQRTGTIPQEISRMSALTMLKMQGNSLTGSIPYQMEDMVSLSLIDLADNALTGVIDLCDLVLREGDLDTVIVTGNELNCYADCWLGETNKIIYNTDKSGDEDSSTLDYCRNCPAGKYSKHYYHNISDPYADEGYFCESCPTGKYSLVSGMSSEYYCEPCPIDNGLFYSQVAGPQCFPEMSGEKDAYVGGPMFEVGAFMISLVLGFFGGSFFGVLLGFKRANSERVHPLSSFVLAMKSGLCGFNIIAELTVAMAFTMSSDFFLYGFCVIFMRATHIFLGSFIVMRMFNITNGRSLAYRSQYEDLVDQKHLFHYENQGTYATLSILSCLDLQYIQMMPWINTDYAHAHQGWPDVMTYYGVIFYKTFQASITSVIFMLFVSFTDNTTRGDALLALISLYIMFSGVLILYNLIVELAIMNSWVANKKGTDQVDINGELEEEPLKPMQEGARKSVFVDFGTGYRKSLGFGGMATMDNPVVARKSLGFKDMVSNPMAGMDMSSYDDEEGDIGGGGVGDMPQRIAPPKPALGKISLPDKKSKKEKKDKKDKKDKDTAEEGHAEIVLGFAAPPAASDPVPNPAPPTPLTAPRAAAPRGPPPRGAPPGAPRGAPPPRPPG